MRSRFWYIVVHIPGPKLLLGEAHCVDVEQCNALANYLLTVIIAGAFQLTTKKTVIHTAMLTVPLGSQY